MEKFTDSETGRIAVLVSSGWGLGWFCDHGCEQLVYDPKIVRWVLDGYPETQRGSIVAHVQAILAQQATPVVSVSDIKELDVVWLPPGEQFIITSYDGMESVISKSDTQWLTA